MNSGLMELEETLYWLEIIEETTLVAAAKLEPLKTETTALIAIFVSLIKKWRAR